MLGFRIWKVKGHSMAPIIPQGCFVLITNILRFLPVKAGQRLLIDHPEFGFIVKTVAIVDRNGLIWSKGENASSVTVEQLGPINKTQIIGRVIRIFKPEARPKGTPKANPKPTRKVTLKDTTKVKPKVTPKVIKNLGSS